MFGHGYRVALGYFIRALLQMIGIYQIKNRRCLIAMLVQELFGQIDIQFVQR